MPLKEVIKSKVCLISITPNYPLLDFVKWAENIDSHELLLHLDEIQIELDKEEASLRQINWQTGISSYQLLQSYWCLYCAQIRAYYRAIIRHPFCKTKLSFLLQ